MGGSRGVTSAQDLIGEATETLAPEDRARSQLYRLLAANFSRAPARADLERGACLLGDESPFGQAVDRFAAACRSTTPERSADDYHVLFIGLGRGELIPYESYYLTGFLQEKPLARLRADMARLGLSRAEDESEPEDHAASILEMMAALVDGAYGPRLTLPAQKMFFDAHIGSWMSHFFRDLEATTNSELFAALGEVGRRFLSIEEEAFRMV